MARHIAQQLAQNRHIHFVERMSLIFRSLLFRIDAYSCRAVLQHILLFRRLMLAIVRLSCHSSKLPSSCRSGRQSILISRTAEAEPSLCYTSYSSERPVMHSTSLKPSFPLFRALLLISNLWREIEPQITSSSILSTQTVLYQ
jgi:hypothetical protein